MGRRYGRGNSLARRPLPGDHGGVHRTTADLLAGLPDVERSPADVGTVELIVRRPAPGQRDVLVSAELSVEHGLVGDSWLARGSRHTEDGSAELDRQLTIANSRALALLSDDRDRWPLAGDQLYVDLDLSVDRLPAGTRLRIGAAVVEVTAAPHTGCAKFADRFGMDAARFVSSTDGARLRLRGINARVVEAGTVRCGDEVRRTGS
jgi:hypothetical protein